MSRSDRFNAEEKKFIEEAAAFFENPGWFMKGVNLIGAPLEKAQKMLPASAQLAIAKATKKAVERALVASIKTVPLSGENLTFAEAKTQSARSGRLHAAAATAIGGAGGLFGLVSLPIELPLSTMLILRSIVDTAQKFGNDLNSLEVRLECIYVFSLGNHSIVKDLMNSAYYTSRFAFSETIQKVAAFIASSSTKDILTAIEKGSAPFLVRFIAEISEQLGVRVSRKLLAQAAPVAGALGGAGINLLFANYFQEAAKFHFGLKKLEAEKGLVITQNAFEIARKKQSG